MEPSGSLDQLPLPEQVRRLHDELARAQRLAALGELLGTTTHEFNNVLTTIINYAKLGLRHKDAATREKSFDRILTASQRAAKITSSVLAMARAQRQGAGSGKFEPVDLPALVEDALMLLERELNKYHVVVEKYFHAVPKVRVNPGQIQQVLLNLLTNARQAMPHGGRVVLKISHDEAAKTVDVMVRDNGSGIPPEVLPRIFEAFFTTKTGPDASGKGGAGLGLSMCREIIESHKGRIRVESTLGKGTAFTLRFPIEVPAEVPAEVPVEVAEKSVPQTAQARSVPTRNGNGGSGPPVANPDAA
ncbi:MAG: sensor histidine kinase [Planctomycetia bacterium]|nr:sensor histidine kinase [Planctomycetia bacterium]